MGSFFDQEIKFLRGVGPKRADLLNKELDIYTFEDLLTYYPYRYIDRSRFFHTNEIHPDLAYIQLKGKIGHFRLEGGKARKRLMAEFSDKYGSLELVWFHGFKWIKDGIKEDKEYVVFGKPSLFNGKLNLIHPEIEDAEQFSKKIATTLQAQYNTSEKLKKYFIHSRIIHKLQNTLIQTGKDHITETLPAYVLKKANLIGRKEALVNIHFPENQDQLNKANYRLKFEELFFIQLNLLKQKVLRKTKYRGFRFSKVGRYVNDFYNHYLHFPLTEAQKRVIKEIRQDLGSGLQMNRLLQGDVGSGKTLVALMAMLIALDNGYQACMMAPTEILAQQHYKTILRFLEKLDVSLKLLTGSTRKKERDDIHEGLTSGKLQILIGTHALIEEKVVFRKLGFVVIDEQHRFGVAQRARLWEKSNNPPHMLVMTATPIPRTLAMTLYGDLDISVIDEMPPGRIPIKTLHFNDSQRNRVFGFMRKQIEAGQQIFVVYPLISESEKMDYKDLEDGYESITRAFPPPQYAVSVVHGRMKPAEKEIAMHHFVEGRTHIMVATTVIEVGVDIPNASVMIIESAERFGLSQLHQLRGRVGRGSDQSYCILMSSHKLSGEARKRLETMVRTNDGFEIAEADLKLRGPGDLEGTQQSGMPIQLKISNLARDGQILQFARQIAESIIGEDPSLQEDKNRILAMNLQKMKAGTISWGDIS